MRALRWLSLATVVGAYVVIVLGGYVSASKAGFACPDWPLCYGSVFPPFDQPGVAIEWTHRLAALVEGLLTLSLLVLVWWRYRARSDLLSLSTLGFVLLAFQIVLGMVTVGTQLSPDLNPAIVTLHLGIAVGFFATALLITVLVWWPPRGFPASHDVAGAAEVTSVDAAEPPAGLAKDFLTMVKPGILFLLVATGVTAMVVARGTRLSFELLFFTALGGALAAGSANCLNNYLDRSVDRTMRRTRNRPLPAGRLPPQIALAVSVGLGAAAVAVLALYVNPLASILAVGGIAFYAPLYTVWLKPMGPQNIVIGGAAGAFPALVGWAAATGTVELPAILLGALVFLWTPPHFWSLAIVFKEDYRRAGLPMMPVAAGEVATRRRILGYSAALVAASLLLVPWAGMSWIYAATAVALGATLLFLALRMQREAGLRWARATFSFSIWYLLLLFVAVVADRILL